MWGEWVEWIGKCGLKRELGREMVGGGGKWVEKGGVEMDEEKAVDGGGQATYGERAVML